MSVAVGGKNRDTGCPQTCAKALKQPPKTCRTKQNKPTWDEGYVLSTFIFNDTESKYSKRCRRCHVTTASSVQTFVLSAFKPSSPNLKCEKMKADTLSVWVIKVSSHNDFRGSEFLFWSVTARHESRGSAQIVLGSWHSQKSTLGICCFLRKHVVQSGCILFSVVVWVRKMLEPIYNWNISR